MMTQTPQGDFDALGEYVDSVNKLLYEIALRSGDPQLAENVRRAGLEGWRAVTEAGTALARVASHLTDLDSGEMRQLLASTSAAVGRTAKGMTRATTEINKIISANQDSASPPRPPGRPPTPTPPTEPSTITGPSR